MPKLIEELHKLTAIDAPSGFEEPVLRYSKDRFESLGLVVEQDIRGNLYARIDQPELVQPTVMITAHADEIGLMVTSIRSDGFLRFTTIGQPTQMILPGQRVRILSGKQGVEGLVGVMPGHILSGDAARQVPSVENLYIDIGAASGEELETLGIQPGTPAVLIGELTETAHAGRWFGKAVDNRAGLITLFHLAERLIKRELSCDLVFVVTVEEEIGLRGAMVAAERLRPDVVLAIDTVPSGGTPELSQEQLPWVIGQGPLLKIRESKGLSTHPKLRQLVIDTANDQKIPYQLIVDTAGITDAASAQQASSEIAAMVIGLARRYSHSAVEMFDLSDLEAIIDLTEAVVVRMKTTDQFLRV